MREIFPLAQTPRSAPYLVCRCGESGAFPSQRSKRVAGAPCPRCGVYFRRIRRGARGCRGWRQPASVPEADARARAEAEARRELARRAQKAAAAARRAQERQRQPLQLHKRKLPPWRREGRKPCERPAPTLMCSPLAGDTALRLLDQGVLL